MKQYCIMFCEGKKPYVRLDDRVFDDYDKAVEALFSWQPTIADAGKTFRMFYRYVHEWEPV